MRLDSIHLENYRCHVDLQVGFKSAFNVIVGVNGSGKTSLLRAVCDALTGLTQKMSIRSGGISPLRDENVVRMKVELTQGRYRFEPQYPVKVVSSGRAFGLDCAWAFLKTNALGSVRLDGKSPGEVWEDIQQAAGSGVEEDRLRTALPVVAFYRANRHWNQPQPHELQAATMRNARYDGYANWWDASLDSSALQAWAIAKGLERFQTSSETGVAFDEIDSDELALVNAALVDAVEGVKGLKYDLKQKSLLVEWMAGDVAREPTAFENLSDGQRAVIGLVADIARRMCVLNPQLGQEATRRTPGVVLVDELDMHLHPRWQRILTRGLKRAFPNLQFIVASHSPQVLGELSPDEIILLRPGGTEHPQVSYGLTSSQILEEVMGAEPRTPEVERRLADLFETLERGDLSEAQGKIDALEGFAPGIPELAGAQALLHRKEVLGR